MTATTTDNSLKSHGISYSCLDCRKTNVILQLQCRLGVVCDWLEIHNKIVLDGKHGVVFQILGVLVKDLRNQGCVLVIASLLRRGSQRANSSAWLEITKESTNHDVDVSWPVRVAVQKLQQLASGT